MSNDLKKQLIKLGSTNPELRPHISQVLDAMGGRGQSRVASEKATMTLLVFKDNIMVQASAPMDEGRLSGQIENGKHFKAAVMDTMKALVKALGQGKPWMDEPTLKGGRQSIIYETLDGTMISALSGVSALEVEDAVSKVRSRVFKNITVQSWL